MRDVNSNEKRRPHPLSRFHLRDFSFRVSKLFPLERKRKKKILSSNFWHLSYRIFEKILSLRQKKKKKKESFKEVVLTHKGDLLLLFSSFKVEVRARPDPSSPSSPLFSSYCEGEPGDCHGISRM